MKFGPVAKPRKKRKKKKKKKTSKKIDKEFMLENCDVIATFPIYSQFGAFQKLDSGRIACKMLNLVFN